MEVESAYEAVCGTLNTSFATSENAHAVCAIEHGLRHTEGRTHEGSQEVVRRFTTVIYLAKLVDLRDQLFSPNTRGI